MTGAERAGPGRGRTGGPAQRDRGDPAADARLAGRSHDRAVQNRVKQQLWAAIAAVHQQHGPEEGPMPTTLGGFPTTDEDDDPGLGGDVYGS